MEPPKIHPVDVARYHAAARLIEDDMCDAYRTCRQRYGPEIAGVVLVTLLRDKLNPNKNQWPPPEELTDLVNELLVQKGILDPFP